VVAGAGGGGAQGCFSFLPASVHPRWPRRYVFLFCLSQLHRPATARPATPASPSLFCKGLGGGGVISVVRLGAVGLLCVSVVPNGQAAPIFLSPFLTLGGRRVFLFCPPLPSQVPAQGRGGGGGGTLLSFCSERCEDCVPRAMLLEAVAMGCGSREFIMAQMRSHLSRLGLFSTLCQGGGALSFVVFPLWPSTSPVPS